MNNKTILIVELLNLKTKHNNNQANLKNKCKLNNLHNKMNPYNNLRIISICIKLNVLFKWTATTSLRWNQFIPRLNLISWHNHWIKGRYARWKYTNTHFLLRVIARCNNPEFNDLDEDVFSVRSNDEYEFFEEVRFKIKKDKEHKLK
jgi:hypothetical protein